MRAEVERPFQRRIRRLPPVLRLPSRVAQETDESIRIHDLKNLACRLTALVQNLAEHYDDPLFKDSAMEVLRDTVERMNLMVSRYRRQRERVSVKLKVNLNDLLRGIVAEIPLSIFPRVRLREDYRNIPPIWGEDYYLRSAVLSIVANALEAMPSGGTLTLRTRTSGRGGKQRAVVEIEDTGVGMTRSFIRRRLFFPFATTKPKGLGLGLYNARQIIHLHGGAIEVRSIPRRGTLLRLRFDAATEPAS